MNERLSGRLLGGRTDHLDMGVLREKPEQFSPRITGGAGDGDFEGHLITYLYRRDLWSRCLLKKKGRSFDLPDQVRGEKNLYRFEYWNRLRAPFCPYFFLSLTLGSRVSNPSFFKAVRDWGIASKRALEMP